MGNTHARLMLSAISGEKSVDQREIIERIVTTQTAYLDAIEHVLGVPAGSLTRTDTQTAQAWIIAMRKGMENNE